MGEKLEKVKNHVKKHKVAYISFGGGFVLATITIVIMKRRYEGLGNAGPYGSETIDNSITMRPLSFLSSQKNVVKVIARDGRGHPGYLIHSLDTNEYFSSQREAASIFGISETLLSKHLSGKLPNAEGYQFERLSFAT